MYVHIGEDVMIWASDIITIIEKETVDSSEDIQLHLQKKADVIEDLSHGADYKSLVITESHIYLSPIASGTIKKRLTKLADEELFVL